MLILTNEHNARSDVHATFSSQILNNSDDSTDTLLATVECQLEHRVVQLAHREDTSHTSLPPFARFRV